MPECSDRKSHYIPIRLSTGEVARLDRAAAAVTGGNRSEVIRLALSCSDVKTLRLAAAQAGRREG